VENRDHNPEGDFYLDESGRVHENRELADDCRTFSGISVMHKKLFDGLPIRPLSTVPLLQEAMGQNKVSGELYSGLWVDVGTPERLQHVNSL
jgi:MurNAc alpha-1-phosphate uridylyltransferase